MRRTPIIPLPFGHTGAFFLKAERATGLNHLSDSIG